MNGLTRLILIAALAIFCSSYELNSQNIYNIDSVGLSITGESTLHDWTVVANDIQDFPSQLSFLDGSSKEIGKFSFRVKVSSLDGGRGSAMNKKIFKALKSESHPFIVFALSQPASLDAEETTLMVKGSLSIAGNSKLITPTLKGDIANDKLVFTGSYALKMTDFQIEPPSAMFGQIQTKDDIVVHFTFRYKKENDE